MNPQKRLTLTIVLFGGAAVLGSYVQGLVVHSDIVASLWGGLPRSLRLASQANMIPGALGFLAFTYLVLFRLPAGELRIAGRFRFGLFSALYALVLAPSAAWMPLTIAYVRDEGSGLWLTIRLVLWAVAVGSVGLLISLLTLRPRGPRRAYTLAVVGCLFFCLQTVALDAILWVAYFR